MIHQEETVFACLTPAGVGAIATFAVLGPEAWRIARTVFTPWKGELPEDPSAVDPGRFYLGEIGSELRDEGMLTLRRAIPDLWVEFHCHGGREVLALLAEALRQQGAQELSWGNWQRRVLGASVRAAAAIGLAHAPTARTAAILLDQYHGAFDRALSSVRQAIRKGDPQGAMSLLADLVRHAELGQRLTSGWRVVIAGAPNVGKSSLVNALAGFQRCVVSAIPGTTRDVVTTRLAIDGWPIELSDTAGLRESEEELEQAGMGLARQTASRSDLCLWVVDASIPPTWPVHLEVPFLVVINKIDLPAGWDLGIRPDAVRVSARTGQGLAELCQAISRGIVSQSPGPGQAVPITAEWCERLRSAQQAWVEGKGEEVERLLG